MRLPTLVLTAFLVLAMSPAQASSSLFHLDGANCARAFTNPPVVQNTVASPHLIVFSAPSGGGKTTLANLLIKEFPNLVLSVSSTTRAPRGQEKDGVDYHFLDQKNFEAKIQKGQFAEYAQVHGNYYGTDISAIRQAFAEGKSVLSLVDVTGAKNLKQAFPGEVFTIFINPPDLQTLETRLRGRGTDTEEVIKKRLENAKKELLEGKKYDVSVINDDLNRALGELRKILVRYRLVVEN